MVWLLYGAELAAVLCFVVAFERLGVPSAARHAIRSALDASKTMRDAALSDDEKERVARKASLVLLRSFGSITVRSAAAVGASFVPLVLFQAAGLARISAVNSLMLSWRGILVALAAVALVYVARGRM